MKNIIIIKLAEWILESEIFESAMRRGNAKDKISNMKYTIFEHLFKVYLMPNSIHKEKWIKEIDNFLKIVSEITWGDRDSLFSKKEYYEMLFVSYFAHENTYKRMVKDTIKDYNDEYHIKYNLDGFKSMSEAFFKKISLYLEENTYDKESLIETLDEEGFLN